MPEPSSSILLHSGTLQGPVILSEASLPAPQRSVIQSEARLFTKQHSVILSEATRSLIARGAVEGPATPPAAAILSMVSTHKPHAWYADAL